jgi:hypothetical protein
VEMSAELPIYWAALRLCEVFGLASVQTILVLILTTLYIGVIRLWRGVQENCLFTGRPFAFAKCSAWLVSKESSF